MSPFPLVSTRIGKHTFVAGLTWVPLTRLRELKNDAKAQVLKYGGDAYVIRHVGGVAQVGVTSSAEGAAPGQLSIAAAVADHVARSSFAVNGKAAQLHDWIGIFQLPEEGKWFLIAVREGAIVSNCDRISSYEDAVDLLEQTYGIGGWTAVVGSPDLDIRNHYHNFLPLTIEEALGLKGTSVSKPRQYAIHTKGSAKKKTVMAAVAALLGLALLAGGWMYQTHQEEKAAAELAALQAELALLQQQPAIAPGPIPKGWHSQPIPASLVRRCMDHLDIPAAPGSWVLSGYRCNQGGSTVLLTRSAVSTVGHLKELLPEAQVSADQNTASWTRAFDTMDMRTEALAGWHSLETLLYSRMQTLNVSLSIGAPTIPGHPATGGKSVESGADWTERSFTIGPAPFMPQTITPMLDMDGVRLTSISYTDGNWTYEGTIYAH